MAQPTRRFGSQGSTSQQATGMVSGQQGQQMQLPQPAQQVQSPQQGQQFQSGQQSDGTLEQSLLPEMQQALQQFFEAAKVCEWCADRCAEEGQGMAECIRLCRDVADIASLNARFIARDSAAGPELAEVFTRFAQECARECARHPHGHCQDCARVLGQAVQSVQQMLQSLQSAGGEQQLTQQVGSGGMQSQQGMQGQLGQF